MVRVLKGKAIIKSIDDRNYQLTIDDLNYHYNIELVAVNGVRIVAKILSDGILLSKVDVTFSTSDIKQLDLLYRNLRSLYLYQGTNNAIQYIKGIIRLTKKLFGVDI